MKIAAVVLAVVVATFAPLASAQPQCNNAGNAAALQALQISNTVKRKSVLGGKQVVQAVKIKNTASTTATGLQIGSGPINADLTYVTAKAWTMEKGAAAPTWTVDPQGPFIASSPVNIPPKKTLKVTITYNTAQCPTQANPHDVSLGVQIPGDGAFTCYVSATRPPFTIKKGKNCP